MNQKEEVTLSKLMQNKQISLSFQERQNEKLKVFTESVDILSFISIYQNHIIISNDHSLDTFIHDKMKYFERNKDALMLKDRYLDFFVYSYYFDQSCSVFISTSLANDDYFLDKRFYRFLYRNFILECTQELSNHSLS